MPDFLSVHITVSSKAEAEKIARALVEGHLAACVNIVPEIRSIYRWEGKVEAAHEVLLLAKTRADLFPALAEKVKDLHSYSCPCIVAEPISAGYQPYLDWIKDATQAS